MKYGNTSYNSAAIAAKNVDDFVAQQKDLLFPDIKDPAARIAKIKQLHADCTAEVAKNKKSNTDTSAPAPVAKTGIPVPDAPAAP